MPQTGAPGSTPRRRRVPAGWFLLWLVTSAALVAVMFIANFGHRGVPASQTKGTIVVTRAEWSECGQGGNCGNTYGDFYPIGNGPVRRDVLIGSGDDLQVGDRVTGWESPAGVSTTDGGLDAWDEAYLVSGIVVVTGLATRLLRRIVVRPAWP